MEVQFRSPSPAPAISLNELAFTLQLGRIGTQQLRHSFNSVPPIIANYVRVHCNRDAWISVTQLLLHHLGGRSGVGQRPRPFASRVKLVRVGIRRYRFWTCCRPMLEKGYRKQSSMSSQQILIVVCVLASLPILLCRDRQPLECPAFCTRTCRFRGLVVGSKGQLMGWSAADL